MYCSKCGNEIQGDNKFCTNCGAPVKGIVKNIPLDIDSSLNEVPESNEPKINKAEISKPVPKKSKKGIIGIVIGAAAVLIIAGVVLYQFWDSGKDKKEKKTETETVQQIPDMNQEQTDTVEEPEDIVTATFGKTEYAIPMQESLNLLQELSVSSGELTDVIWDSDNPSAVTVDNNGNVCVNSEDANATITVKSKDSLEVIASCKVRSFTKVEALGYKIEKLNGENAQLQSIDLTSKEYSPGKRNTKYTWDNFLFYSLEDISPESPEDGLINGYTIEKKRLVSAASGNIIDYEIYREPSSDIINKIVSIEYLEDKLAITDYYYEDDGSVNFVFSRMDINYIPTYANPSINGERYYYYNDTLVKWRSVKDGKQVNYVIGKKEKERGYNAGKVTMYKDLSDKKKDAYDKKEITILNEAYNTYNIVKDAESINVITGHVIDEDTNAVDAVAITLYSEDLKDKLYEATTDSFGEYKINVPATGEVYSIVLSKSGYTETTVYRVTTANDQIDTFQEIVNLVHDVDYTYEVTLALCDAFNQEYGEMVRLDYAEVYFRKGINNREGEIYKSIQADGYGNVVADLEPGSYTIEVGRSDYATSYHTIVAKEGISYLQINTSPILGENEVRIVLTWNQYPYDLDSHLFTPYDKTSQDTTYHIWYGNRSDANANNLDVDQTEGYGPETMTINNLTNGLYKYYVVDYTDCSKGTPDSREMSYSSACVSVYTKEGLVQTFYVPTNLSGSIWEVFEIRNKKIVPIQRYYSNIEDKTWWNNEK